MDSRQIKLFMQMSEESIKENVFCPNLKIVNNLEPDYSVMFPCVQSRTPLKKKLYDRLAAEFVQRAKQLREEGNVPQMHSVFLNVKYPSGSELAEAIRERHTEVEAFTGSTIMMFWQACAVGRINSGQFIIGGVNVEMVLFEDFEGTFGRTVIQYGTIRFRMPQTIDGQMDTYRDFEQVVRRVFSIGKTQKLVFRDENQKFISQGALVAKLPKITLNLDRNYLEGLKLGVDFDDIERQSQRKLRPVVEEDADDGFIGYRNPDASRPKNPTPETREDDDDDTNESDEETLTGDGDQSDPDDDDTFPEVQYSFNPALLMSFFYQPGMCNIEILPVSNYNTNSVSACIRANFEHVYRVGTPVDYDRWFSPHADIRSYPIAAIVRGSDEVIGFVDSHTETGKNGLLVVVVDHICVRPAVRGNKVGTTLMDALAHVACKIGASLIIYKRNRDEDIHEYDFLKQCDFLLLPEIDSLEQFSHPQVISLRVRPKRDGSMSTPGKMPTRVLRFGDPLIASRITVKSRKKTTSGANVALGVKVTSGRLRSRNFSGSSTSSADSEASNGSNSSQESSNSSLSDISHASNASHASSASALSRSSSGISSGPLSTSSSSTMSSNSSGSTSSNTSGFSSNLSASLASSFSSLSTTSEESSWSGSFSEASNFSE